MDLPVVDAPVRGASGSATQVVPEGCCRGDYHYGRAQHRSLSWRWTARPRSVAVVARDAGTQTDLPSALEFVESGLVHGSAGDDLENRRGRCLGTQLARRESWIDGHIAGLLVGVLAPAASRNRPRRLPALRRAGCCVIGQQNRCHRRRTGDHATPGSGPGPSERPGPLSRPHPTRARRQSAAPAVLGPPPCTGGSTRIAAFRRQQPGPLPGRWRSTSMTIKTAEKPFQSESC